jgi:hypothetical protein
MGPVGQLATRLHSKRKSSNTWIPSLREETLIMTTPIHRRSFIKRAAAAGAVVSVSQVFPIPNILQAANTGSKLNCAVIGCGGRYPRR